MVYMNHRKEAEVDFARLKKIAKKLLVPFNSKTSKSDLMHLVGNKLLQNKIVTLKDTESIISRTNLAIMSRKVIREIDQEKANAKKGGSKTE